MARFFPGGRGFIGGGRVSINHYYKHSERPPGRKVVLELWTLGKAGLLVARD